MSVAGKISVRNCPICSGTRCEVLHRQRFVLPEGHPLVHGYDVVCCERCGFVYADTEAGQQDYDIYYARFSPYEDNQTSTGSGESARDAERLCRTAACIAEQLPNRDVRVLDIGCAGGGLLKALKDLGYSNLSGLDPATACVKHTQSLGVGAYEGSLFSIPEDMGTFDLVILSHVLEHVQSLKLSVQRIRELITSVGVVYVEVPDACRYADFVTSPFQEFGCEHINYFSQRCLSDLFQSNGWRARAQGEKQFLLSQDTPYPAIYAFYERREHPADDYGYGTDRELRNCMKAYIFRSQEILDTVEVRLQRMLQRSSEVIVWGAGGLAMKLLADTSLSKARIVAFVDGNPVKRGKMLQGIPILAPEEIRAMKCPVLIASIYHEKEIVETIRSRMKLENEIIVLGKNEYHERAVARRLRTA